MKGPVLGAESLNVTELIEDIANGERERSDDLLRVVYADLKRAAEALMSQERGSHTLQATALVHEAYIRLVGKERDIRWECRAHFFSAAAEAMRRILIEYARRKAGKQRGGGRQRLNLDDAFLVLDENTDAVLQVNDALQQLAREDKDAADLLKLKYFSGLSISEASELLEISRSSAYAHWAFAKARLMEILEG